MANQKCVYGQVWDIPIPTSCRIVREDCHSMVDGTLYYRYRHLWVLRGPRAIGYIKHLYPHHGKLGMRFGCHYSRNCPVLRADGLFYGSQDHVLSVPPVMDPSQGLFGTKSYFTPKPGNHKCVYGHACGAAVPTNCRVVRVDGHITLVRTLYYQ